jgi:hypothetical protein
MGTEIKKSISAVRPKIELVADKTNFSKKVNHLLDTIKIKRLDEKEIQEIAIESYTCTY